MIKKYKAKEQENKEKEDIIEQEKIIIRKEKRIILQELLIKPIITSKNTQGVLEAHTNGLRYISTKGEKVDIIYKNIKHAFLQTCETELTAILHFNLKNPILVGKKKLYDVQFYKDIGSQVEHLNSRGVGNDYEEYEMELKERKKIESINKEFIRFASNVEELSEIKFDVPFRELEFTGVPFRSNVTLFPTQNCIISLGELPFFVITINEIDIIYFERVSQSLKNFDMAFIFKDLSRPIKRITAIPMENLDMLKTWADENDILFGEGLYNMNWPHVINSIKEDPETFIQDGCWNFLADNGSEDEEEEEGEDPDPEYEEEEYESSESDYDDDEEEEIESEGEDEGDSALSEQGKSWDSLSKEALKSDKEHAKKIKEEEKFKKNKKNNKSKKK
jgi:nucleosome binding factor SPN SPT16 subunit